MVRDFRARSPKEESSPWSRILTEVAIRGAAGGGARAAPVSRKGGGRMAKSKERSKTNVSARAEAKAQASQCRLCGGKIEVVMRLPGRRMARLCCERAASKAA